MKTAYITILLLLGAFLSNAQFNELGYKNIKIGMTKEEVRKIATINFLKIVKLTY